MTVIYSQLDDFDAWISLAREVEPLFGPMADDVSFQDAVKEAIQEKRAYCIIDESGMNNRALPGGVVVSKESNEIAWLAVSQQYRGVGYGRQLIEFAINELNSSEDIFVQTFDASAPGGASARRLYSDFGFTDFKNGGLNPAGIQTVIMRLAGVNSVCAE